MDLFRKDLELNKKWWHRLLKVVYIFGFVVGTIIAINNFIYHPKYKEYTYKTRVSYLNITNEMKSVADFLEEGEILGLNKATWGSDIYEYDSKLKNLIFCSTSFTEEDIKSLSKRFNTTFYVDFNNHEMGYDELYTVSAVVNRIENSCLVIGDINLGDSSKFGIGINHPELHKIEIYHKENKTICIIKNILYALLVYLVYSAIILLSTYIIYYYGLIYIIYGSKKSKKNNK